MKKFTVNLNTHTQYILFANHSRKLISQFSKTFISLVIVLSLSSTINAGTTATFIGYPNNSTDNTAALISQLQNCETLIIPAGGNYYKFSGTATIPTGKKLSFNSGAKFNVTGNIIGNQTIIIAGENEIFTNTSNINGTWSTETVYVKWFGAIGNGTTDDYASLKEFFDFLNITDYNWAKFENSKEYYIKNQISHTVKKEIKIDGNGSRIFRKYSDLNSNESILALSGTVEATRNVSADLEAGQMTMTLDNVTGLYPGMGFTLNSSELFGKEELAGDYWHYHNKGIMSKIVSVNGNTITMADTIPFDMSKDYFTSSSLKFYEIQPVTINNLNFGSESIVGTYSMNQLKLSSLFDVTVENVVCDPLGYSGISASSVYNGYFNNISLIRPANWPNKIFGLYGIVASLNVNCVYNNILGRAVTHGIAFTALSNAPSNKVEVLNSDFKADRSGSNGADSHASQWVKFSNCTIWGAQWNWGTVIFDNCEMREFAIDGTNVFNEREGASRGGLQAYFVNGFINNGFQFVFIHVDHGDDQGVHQGTV